MMIAEQYLSGSRLYRRLRNGPHRELVEHYAARLIELGLAREGTLRSLNLVSDLLSWIANRRSAMTDLDEPSPEAVYLSGRPTGIEAVPCCATLARSRRQNRRGSLRRTRYSESSATICKENTDWR